ncbi:hypothetical protein SARC_07533 [Sphaeroforma arctica JP610]|uniref:Uncharacterized protein n=1 Tax=Sphaeroforma arctica JP610 TaxID=667725 RepID=A0A0L0FTF8_9EUKA|nr:hypothetical protein SARC_07533 [Sphaeroforma arctica JP610]KNC80090.1 hypothetical protein SARC_07533 [Sphaeroforma arctica JP610]|eukprot:XP_014153992.1 hypothetical protein SARC_07533 [Sphaeroforma arctica JP610]
MGEEQREPIRRDYRSIVCKRRVVDVLHQIMIISIFARHRYPFQQRPDASLRPPITFMVGYRSEMYMEALVESEVAEGITIEDVSISAVTCSLKYLTTPRAVFITEVKTLSTISLKTSLMATSTEHSPPGAAGNSTKSHDQFAERIKELFGCWNKARVSGGGNPWS